ncbi:MULTISPECIES: sensor histidine kinase [unclassified Streptomyces]|uniref:sensor histidine kinase n=1 Tax=unclassified Streptomyces TaxID=2593676 RepID=UPI0016608FF0|nr:MULTISPECIES: histidine kinase [unclassified Streptomyces]MBD0712039.1 two-component sensor histidine kinase [Streptomyces sp. CBMA291]MBD0717976.1 two-component sensor histidine kinase [Streptomyces sp. CBMA370]
MVRVTQTRSPETSRSPEIRLVQAALGGLRQELFHDVLAYRPLPRMDTGTGPARFLPKRIREYAGLVPHAFVVLCAVFVFAVGYERIYYSFGLPSFVVVGVPAALVLLTLVRPVLAFWASLGSSVFVGYLGGFVSGWPWSPNTFAAHLVILGVVAARTRPRTAVWMWILTACHGVFFELFLGMGSTSDTVPVIFGSALVLLTVTVFQVRRQADREVIAERTVTAEERSKRTLLEERTTIARELHDVVAHHMSVVAIQAEAAPYRVDNPPPELEQAFRTIRENAVAALTELRRILGVVRAEDYEAPEAPQPTLTDLEALVANVREAGLVVDKTVTGAIRELPQGVELSAYRIVQEALSNVLRHAPGAAAKVEVSYVLGGLGLRVANGPARGLVKPSPGAGHGITGMRERVTMLGGEMTAEATGDGGYEVTAFVPVSREEADR